MLALMLMVSLGTEQLPVPTSTAPVTSTDEFKILTRAILDSTECASPFIVASLFIFPECLRNTN